MRPLLTVLAMSGALLAGCGAQDPSAGAGPTTSPVSSAPATTRTVAPSSTSAASVTTETTATQATTTAAPPGTIIQTGESTLGPVLFDGTGQAIYLFDVEADGVPACYDDCAVAWPPVVSEGAPVAGAGADATLLGTTARTDGTTQLTYGGQPLYFYAHEGKNEVRCHNIREFGGLWLAVSPSGAPAPF